MATKKQLGWGKLLMILTVLPCCRSLEVFFEVKEYEVARGGDIAMKCSFVPSKPDIQTLVIRWVAIPDKAGDPMITVASYFLNVPVDIAPTYEGRATLENNIDKRESTLHLKKVTMQDSRRYACSVLIHGDIDGKTTDTTSLLVLVAPSPPICKLQGTAEYYNNITLTCVSQEGSPQPVYSWKSYSVENVPRQLPPKATEKDGSLSLFNISRETSGFFICTSQNQVGSASCNFTLAVMPNSMNIGSTGIIVGAVLAGVLVIGIIIYCCCRKKRKNDKIAEGSPGEVEFYDRDAPETGEQYCDDKSNSETKGQYEGKDVPQSSYNITTTGKTFDDDQHSSISGKEKHDGKGSETESQNYEDNRYGGSRDRLDDQRDRYGGSRDRLDDQRDRYGGSRDRLDDQRDRYGGSRDRLDDQRDRYGGSRDRLDDQRNRYGGSRDRLDDQRDRYGGSRDRLDDRCDNYSGSRDRLEDQRNRNGGSRDRLDDRRDNYGGSRDRLDDRCDRYGGSRDRLDYGDDQYRN